eukprot:TRINITY_DN801_c0_g1_i2.p4 TRINITY_DN801_c0_g1~~TRINITY_DN801_c0_g1_i2.p4  ORF type:complete len:130 (-),score=10.45 TRINITY_DN801_c0_g1_i2:123-512(-)
MAPEYCRNARQAPIRTRIQEVVFHAARLHPTALSALIKTLAQFARPDSSWRTASAQKSKPSATVIETATVIVMKLQQSIEEVDAATAEEAIIGIGGTVDAEGALGNAGEEGDGKEKVLQIIVLTKNNPY